MLTGTFFSVGVVEGCITSRVVHGVSVVERLVEALGKLSWVA